MNPLMLRAVLPWISLLLPVLVAAAPAEMRLPAELRDVEPQPVAGRTGNLWRNQLRFAEWQASAPGTFDAKGWTLGTRSASRPDEELSLGAGRVAFQFELKSGDAATATLNQCLARGRFAKHTETRGRVTDETVVEPPGYPRLDCKLAAPAYGELTLRREALSQRESGSLRFGDHEWTVHSIHNLATQRSSWPMGRFGYEIRSAETAVAAVETINAGRVWFGPGISAEQRQELGAAIAALLSYSVLLEAQDD